MLLYDMDLSHLMVYSQQKESEKLQGNREVKRAKTGEGNFPMLSPMGKVGKGSSKDSPIKALIVIQGLKRIGFPTINLKGVIVVVHKLLGLIVLNVVET